MLFADFIWIVFNCVMIYYSISVIQEGFEFKEYSPTLNWVMAYVFFIFPIAFTLMSFRIIQVNVMKYVLKIEMEDVDKVDTGDVFADLCGCGQGRFSTPIMCRRSGNCSTNRGGKRLATRYSPRSCSP